MHRRTPAVLAVILALCVPAAWGGDEAKKKDAIQKELKLLEGTWDQLSVVEGGKKTVTPEGMQLRTIIRGDSYRVEGDGKLYAQGTLTVDPSQKPRTVDITSIKGESKGMTFLAIYEVKGDELRMCVALPGKARPTEFASPPDSDLTLQFFRRVKVKK